MTNPVETEVKIRIGAIDSICHRIESLGFQLSQPREFEANTLYDTADRQLVGRQMLLRLRTSGAKQVITWKGTPAPGPHKSRPELETAVGSVATIAQIFDQLGFAPVFRYEKYRREYQPPDRAGVVTVDETPIGNFLELEGAGEWIDATAARLGFTSADYVLESYARLYLHDCERRGVPPGFMVF